jgi:hypothetical protein
VLKPGLRHQIAIDRLARRKPLVAGFEPRNRVVGRGRFLAIRREDRAFK